MQLAQQPGVLDGDDSLGGEVLHQPDLLLAKWANFLAVDHDCPDQCIGLKHRDSNLTSCAAELCRPPKNRFSGHVGSVEHLFSPHDVIERGAGYRLKRPASR